MFLNSSFPNTYVASIMMDHHLLRIKNHGLQQLHCEQKVIVPADLRIHLRAFLPCLFVLLESYVFSYSWNNTKQQIQSCPRMHHQGAPLNDALSTAVPLRLFIRQAKVKK